MYMHGCKKVIDVLLGHLKSYCSIWHNQLMGFYDLKDRFQLQQNGLKQHLFFDFMKIFLKENIQILFELLLTNIDSNT